MFFIVSAVVESHGIDSSGIGVALGLTRCSTESVRVGDVVVRVDRFSSKAYGPASSDDYRLVLGPEHLTFFSSDRLQSPSDPPEVAPLTEHFAFIYIQARPNGKVDFRIDDTGQQRLYFQVAPREFFATNIRLACEVANRTVRGSQPVAIRSLTVGSRGSYCLATGALTVEPPRRSATADRIPCAASAGRSLRRLAEQEVATISNRYRSFVVMLSGGLDSAVSAAVVSKACRKVSLLHARLPEDKRSWETVAARRVARHLAKPLHELALRREHVLPEPLFGADLGRHPWVGLAIRLQRVAARIGECAVSGGPVEFFGRDDYQPIARISSVLGHINGVRALRALHIGSLVRAAVRRRSDDAPPEDCYCSGTGGKRFLFANPLAGACIPTVAPFGTLSHLELARQLVGSGMRVEKLLVRSEFLDDIPARVALAPRIGSPPLPDRWLARRFMSFDEARRVSLETTLECASRRVNEYYRRGLETR